MRAGVSVPEHPLSPHPKAAWPHAAGGGEPMAEKSSATNQVKGLAQGRSGKAVSEGSGAGRLPKRHASPWVTSWGFFPPSV